MREIDPGHEYEIDHIDGHSYSRIVFVKREGDLYPGNIGHHEGINCQELIRVLIARLKYLNNQIASINTECSIGLLQGALYELEERAAKRHKRHLSFDFTDKNNIEDKPFCKVCGHIECNQHKN
jgi:hypothetical protein